jgi:serine/threonine protein kinase
MGDGANDREFLPDSSEAGAESGVEAYEELTQLDFVSPDPFGLANTVIDHKYRVVSEVGRGGFGIVYRGMNQDLEMPVAIKCLRLPGRLKESKRPKLLQQLREEGKILGRLSHQHEAIVRPIDVGSFMTDAGIWVPYLVLEWLDGETLKTFLGRRVGGMSLRGAVSMLDPAAQALALAHTNRIAHRDIKPDNLFLTELAHKRTLKVLDFGIAKALSDQQVFVYDHTKQSLCTPFTPGYGAPEQFDATFGATGPWTDVFALALVLVELITGKPALGAGSFFELGRAAMAPAVRPTPRTRGVNVPDAVEAVMLKALQVEPRDRYGDALSFWIELVDALNTSSGADPGPALAQKRNTWPPDPTPLELSYVFSEHDEDLRQDFELHLIPMIDKVISAFHPHEVGARSSWAGRANQQVYRSKIVLILLSQALIESGYCQDVEVLKGLERHKRGELRIVPLRLRPSAAWRLLPFRDLVAIPRFGTPITSWQDPIKGWEDVAESLRLIVEDLRRGSMPLDHGAPPTRVHELGDVFKLSGPPDITFVETKAYKTLKSYLRNPGRGVVIEGPSGVGKTTALEKAIRELEKEPSGLRGPKPVMLNARRREHLRQIEDIESWHKEGLVAIDDFHRLNDALSLRVADYMKCLADEDVREKKLVVVGIPGSGQALIKFGFDIAMRIDVLHLGRVESQDVMRMIDKGEDALRIRIERKADIALAAAGSFNIAQFLCQHICAAADIQQTQLHARAVSWSVSEVVPQLINKLSSKFKYTVSRFGGMGGRSDLTAVQILKEIPGTEDGFLSLPVLSGGRSPLFAEGIKRLLDSGEMRALYQQSSSAEPQERALGEQLFFDEKVPALIVEDPQLIFYLAHTSFRELARHAGKGAVAQARIVIFHSRHDVRWQEAVEKGLRAREYNFDVSRDEVKAGHVWKAELTRTMDQVAIAILLISRDSVPLLTSPDLIRLLEERSRAGTMVLPLLLNTSRFDDSPLSRFSALNPGTLVEALSELEREALWRKMITAVKTHLTRVAPG